MCRFGLKMNPLKYTFGVSAGRFLGFIIPESGIEIDPMKIEAIQKVHAPTCKIEFITEHIIHGFGIPQTLTTD
jgi:hypothetical protein